MKILKEAMAGSIESNDILIKISPNDGVDINLESQFIKQYGDDIKKVISEVLEEKGVTDVLVEATDKGAIDFTIKARVITALRRATEE